MIVSSEDGRHIAWSEDGSVMHVTDLEKGDTYDVNAESGQTLKPLGFIGSDCIYGWGYTSDVFSTDTQTNTLALSQVLIMDSGDSEHQILKTYQSPGMYVTGIRVQDGSIYLSRVAKSGDTYTVQKKDTIMNNGKVAANNVKIELISASRTGVRVKLVLSETAQTENPLAFYAKISNTKEEFISLDKQIPQESTYYVYARGGLDSTWTDPAKAVQRADEQGGVVLNRAQQYVWERGNKKTKIQLDTMEIPDIVLEGTLDKKVLKKKLRKTGTVTDLSGCSLDSVLYEVSAQRPVIAKTGDNTSVVIVGYDEYNTYLYDPVKKETYPYGMNDSTDLFQKAGNIFITYIEAVQAVQK